jgi:hypothetical protein
MVRTIKTFFGCLTLVVLLTTSSISVNAQKMIYFSGQVTNDLFILLKSEGYEVEIYDNPSDAVQAASKGAPVIITVNQYPENRTRITSDLYTRARKKALKMYVEYPDFIPGINMNAKNYLGKLERAVITSSHFFKGDFENFDLLGLSSCSLIPISEDVKPIVSFAKVAGYDKADFGLMNTTVYPLLFEWNKVLISTTCLTNFKTASYRPTDAWKNVWINILGWLTGGDIVLDKWSADPQPMYSATQKLPVLARKNAIEKGSDWFFKSKFIIHPSWYPELMQIAGDGSHPVGSPISEDWSVGDGSFGVLEGHVSNVHTDGSQDVRYMIRNDVQGETAFALSSAGLMMDNQEYLNVSRNLLNYLFNTSNARKGLRNEKKSPVYGMLGWADATPYLFYNDDHARALIGSLGTVANLNDNSWNKKIVETILANFRLSSREGFIGNRLSENEILNNGWEYYNKRTFISPHPHFESWTWACYLWLYDKTNYQPLLEKARTAIGITMNAYPKLWKWTNGIQQEKARMILPLAWLVRVDDTPQHREWLNFMINELIKFQQSNGAIQEELGMNNMGQAGATTSNEDYGKFEASLIARNGDPASDMLYTSNFAFFALNEAAKVTNNPVHMEAVNKLADFLVRIQVKSENHKDIDGAWFRGFDYRRWDYWGSNADEEWGVWCTLTGWIQSWIVSTMVLVEDNTSHWERTKNININKEFEESLWMLNSVK